MAHLRVPLHAHCMITATFTSLTLILPTFFFFNIYFYLLAALACGTQALHLHLQSIQA